MAEANQTSERVLYTSQDGQAIVTNKKLVLGGEQWEIENIAHADVVSRKEVNFQNGLKLNERTTPSIIVGGVCLVVGFLFSWLAVGATGVLSGLLILLALLTYAVAFFFIWRTWMMGLPDLHNLRLALQDPTGAQKEHKAVYTWRDQLEAREVEQAVRQAIAGK